MERIKTYFNNISKKLAIESDIAGGGKHCGDIGTNREVIFQTFLNNHIPNRLKAYLGGEIIGLGDKASGQLDIIVASDIGARFEEKEKTFFIAESVAGVISIKSFLDKAQLFDALDNLSSIPELSSEVLSFDSTAISQKNSFFIYHPSLHILAYDGLAVDTITKHLKEYYFEKSYIRRKRYPTNIIVNGKYCIHYVKKDTKSEYGVDIPLGTFFHYKIEENREGYPLIHLLSELNKYVEWLPHIKINMKEYYNRAFELNREQHNKANSADAKSRAAD
ncbi:DUF6602 domain-containing protein [Planctomycetota bacterium]